jgi:Amt family ammonium transporter
VHCVWQANIMMKNVADLCVGALGFWACGWALAYGVDPKNPANVNSFCGTGEWFLIEGYDYAMWMFQFSFAATAATIDSGAVAERMNFRPYIILSFLVTAFVQPIVCHWCWSEHGLFTKMGFHDFAGSGPVHLVGGAIALVSAWYIGPRTGRFSKADIVGKLVVTVVGAEGLPKSTADCEVSFASRNCAVQRAWSRLAA